ncbi:MAG: hypothetical protein ACRBCI_01170 [Cellvibrionaceae bacterium]
MQKHSLIAYNLLILCFLVTRFELASASLVDISEWQGQHGSTSNDTNSRAPVVTGIESLTDKKNNQNTSTNSFSEKYSFRININNNASVDIGQHKLTHSSLIYKRQDNQGITGSFTLPTLKSRLQSYSIHTSEQVDFNRGIGVEDTNNRTNGLIWDYQAVNNKTYEFTLTGSYLSGKKKLLEADDTSANDAKSMAMNAAFYQRRFAIRSEYAQSRFNSSKANHNIESGNAFYTSLSYTPYPTIPKQKHHNSHHHNWLIGLEKQTTDPQFHSFFNEAIVKDYDATRMFGHYQKKSWLYKLSFSQEKNNINKQLNHTRYTNKSIANSTYQSSKFYPKNSHWYFLGKPRYQLEYTYVNTQESYTQKIDDIALNMDAIFQHPQWQWHLKWGEIKKQNQYQTAENTNNITIGAHFPISKQSNISSNIDYKKYDKNSFDVSTDTLSYVFSVNSKSKRSILFDEAKFEIRQSLSKNEKHNNENNQSLNLSGKMIKNIRRQTETMAGIKIALSGNYHKNASATEKKKDYQAKLSINIILPATN